MKTQVKVEKITPSKAREWLKLNTHNRKISKHNLGRIESAINNNEWILNGESIIMNGTRVLDGQHRLQAVINTGKSIDSVVVRGLDEKVFPTLGSGKVRSFKDTCDIKGESNSQLLSAAVMWIERYMRGMINEKGFTTPTLLDTLRKHPKIRDSVAFVAALKCKTINPSVLAGAHYIFSKKNKEMADVFCSRMATGESLTKNNPIYVLREKIVKSKMNKVRYRPHDQMAMCIKAWNHLRDGKTIKVLQVPSDYKKLKAK